MLLLVLLNICSKIELFPTWPTCVCFLPAICSLLFSQMQNVSQNWDAHLQSWTFSGDKPALGVLICDTPSTDSLCSEGVSSSWTPRQVPENKEVDSEVHDDFTGGRERHHNPISATWKNYSTGLCSGNGVGIKLKSRCSHQVQDWRTGCGPRRKASSTIHSSVNGFYQEHISSTRDTLRK